MTAQLIFGDSGKIEIPDLQIDLLLTCPPYFHPRNKNESKFGVSPQSRSLPKYISEVGAILEKWYGRIAPEGVMVIVKTDFWFQNETSLVGFEIARYLQNKNIRLYRHWIWEQSKSYSPYAPSFANIFVFGKGKFDPKFNGIIDIPKGRNSISNLHYTEIYEFLINCFSERGDRVLDPFAGTGSVLKAAYHKGRNSLGIEISEDQINKALELLGDIPLTVIEGEKMSELIR